MLNSSNSNAYFTAMTLRLPGRYGIPEVLDDYDAVVQSHMIDAVYGGMHAWYSPIHAWYGGMRPACSGSPTGTR